MTEHPLTAHLPVERFGRVLSAKTFAHGLSGAAVHDVTTETGDYVVRIAAHSDAEAWHRELAILRLVSDAGIAPALAWVDEPSLATVSVKITGELAHALADPSARPRAIGNLVATLARLHALPCDGIAVADPVATARRLWRGQSATAGFPQWASPALDHLDECERLLATDERRVLSHNDMNPTNVLWDGDRVWLVDWTAAGRSHPYYDLAVVAMFLRLDDAIALDLLARQEGAELTPAQIGTFRALRRLGGILCGTMFLYLAGDLRSVPASVHETPTLTQFYGMLRTGAVDLRSPAAQATFGAALLREAIAP